MGFGRQTANEEEVAPAGNGVMPVHISDQGVATECNQAIRVLVVDENRTMQQLMVSYLYQHRISVASATGREEIFRHLASGEPDLVILDLRRGGNDGLDLLREIRSQSDVLIIATGHGCDETDRVVGLELGADDFIIKPFGLRELLARIRAVLRRRKVRQVSVQREPGRYRFGGWQLECCTRRMINPDGLLVALTKREYALLVAFLKAPQRPLSREHLLQATRIREDIFDRSIDVQVLRLRCKLEAAAGAPSFIRTVRGIGYVFLPSVERL